MARILLVEDETMRATLVRTRGIDGHEGPDLVVMDIGLKTRDGIDAAIVIHNRTGIRALLASADSDELTLTRATLSAPAGRVSKPYTPTELLTAMENALQRT